MEELAVVYLWADGVYVKAGLEKGKAALLVLIAGLSDGHKVVLAVQSGQRESSCCSRFPGTPTHFLRETFGAQPAYQLCWRGGQRDAGDVEAATE